MHDVSVILYHGHVCVGRSIVSIKGSVLFVVSGIHWESWVCLPRIRGAAIIAVIEEVPSSK